MKDMKSKTYKGVLPIKRTPNLKEDPKEDPKQTLAKNPEIKTLTKKETAALYANSKKIHATWHKFYKFIAKTFGKDLYGPPQELTIGKKTIKFENFNEKIFATRLVGYEVMTK